MKAIYLNPEVKIVSVSVSDILTLSVGTAASDKDLTVFRFDQFDWL